MRRFSFRLEAVLRYRRRTEETKKIAFAIAHGERMLAQQAEERLRAEAERVALLELPIVPELLSRRELYRQLLDDRIATQMHFVALAREKEERAKDDWLMAKREVEVLEKLRAKAWERYEREAAREAQKELDEWAILRAGVRSSAC